MKKWLLLVLIALVGLLGCGGSGNGTPSRGQIMLDTSWPHYNANGDALRRAASIQIEVLESTGPVIATGVQNRPAPVAPTGLDGTSSSWTVGPGLYRFRVTAFDGSDGTGSRLGQTVVQVDLGIGGQLAGIDISGIPLD